MNYIIGTLTILILVTLLPFLYFLYMVEYCRQQRWSPRQTTVPSYREAYIMATKNWISIKSTWLGHSFDKHDKNQLSNATEEILAQSEFINKRICFNIVARLRDYQRITPEFAPDHILLYAMAHLLENELHYYTAHQYNHYIALFINRDGFIDDDLPGYVLESISDKEVSSRIKSIVRQTIQEFYSEGYNYENIVVTIIQHLARTITPKEE